MCIASAACGRGTETLTLKIKTTPNVIIKYLPNEFPGERGERDMSLDWGGRGGGAM